MTKLYIVFCQSGTFADESFEPVIEFMSTSLEEARTFYLTCKNGCESGDLRKSTRFYRFILKSFVLPYQRLADGEGKVLEECCNED